MNSLKTIPHLIEHTDSLDPKISYLLINSNLALQQLCERLKDNTSLALDCEFIRRTTYRPIPALLQLAWLNPSSQQAQLALIDPLGIDNWQPLQYRFANSSREHPIMMHSASEDIQVLRQLGIDQLNLFDTQLAVALNGGTDGIGYSNLVADELGEEPKSNSKIQCSNWLKRPLSDAQLHYALLDVIYLHQLHRILYKRLATLGRDNWHQQECDLLVKSSEDRDPSIAWEWLKGGGRVTNKLARARMKILASWRETHASRLNLVRSMILADDQLIATATNPNELRQHLQSSRFGKRIETALVTKLEQQLNATDERSAATLKRLSITQMNQLKQLQKSITTLAKQLNIPPRILANKRRLFAWTIGKQVDFGKWQTPLITDTLAQYPQQLSFKITARK